jgi:hypothetical protein
MDERARYFRQLRRLRRSARRWSVLAGTAAGATVVLLPYHGLGWPDAVWAALTGGSAALTWWRWSDLRELAARPAPEPLDPARAAAATRARIEAVVARLPAGRGALAELRRVQSRAKLRGSSVVPAWSRLDRAAQTMAGLADRLHSVPAPVVREAAAAERALRDLGERTAAVERAMRLGSGSAAGGGWPGAAGGSPGGAAGPPGLAEAHAELLGRFTEGVAAYEGLVAAAASYVAEDGRLVADGASTGRLREATDLLHGIAAGLSELRVTG